MDDIGIPWKRHRRSKIAREDLPPLLDSERPNSLRWRPADPSNVLPFPTLPQRETTLEEDAENMPL